MERIIDDVLYLASKGDAIGETEARFSAAIDAARTIASDESVPANLVIADDLVR